MEPAHGTKSQRDVRDQRVFTDQWGRRWMATVNNLSADQRHAGYPVGPMRPLFTVGHSLWPPPAHIRVVDKVMGVIRIDTSSWLEELERAHQEYDEKLHETATRLYGDGGAEAIARGDRALMQRIGERPLPIEQVELYEDAHPWVLGLSDEKPKELEAFFPERSSERRRRYHAKMDSGAPASEAAPPAPAQEDDDIPAPKAMEMKAMRAKGATYDEIAKAFGVSRQKALHAVKYRARGN